MKVTAKTKQMHLSCHVSGSGPNPNLQQTVTQPTRKDNILDLFLTNRPNLITHRTKLPGLGNHGTIFIEFSASAKRSKSVK